MANTDRPNGFRPVGTMSGADWNGSVQLYQADGSGDDIFIGDLVTLESDGFVNASNAADEHLLGVCVGVVKQMDGDTTNLIADVQQGNSSINLDRTYYDASADGAAWILVACGVDVLYEVQTSGTIQATDVGNNAEIVATAGDATTGGSRQELSDTTGTAIAQMRIVRPAQRVDNDITAANSRWIVRINEHHFNRVDHVGV